MKKFSNTLRTGTAVQDSWSESLRVSGEHRGLADVVQSAEELDDALQTETGTSMGRCTVLEGFDIVLDCLNGDAK